MDEKVKNKDAEPQDQLNDDLEQGLEETFPGSDPVSASQPSRTDDDKQKPDD